MSTTDSDLAAKLRWTTVENTDELTRYTSQVGGYEIIGHGRPYGGGIRRDWQLKRDGRVLATPSRQVECKGWAQQDWAERLRRQQRDVAIHITRFAGQDTIVAHDNGRMVYSGTSERDLTEAIYRYLAL